MADSEFVIEATDDSFESDVIVRSQLGLVVADFWADWCAPCRMLGPILEKLAEDYQGKFTLVKLETEKAQQAASQFQVTGIPAVFAIWDGQIIDQFQGAMPEDQIREWLDKSLNVGALHNARQLADEDPEQALRAVEEIMAQNAGDAEPFAQILHAQILSQAGKPESAAEIIAKLEERGFLEPEAERIKAELDMQQRSGADIDAARSLVEASPEDWNARLALAEALAGERRFAEACDECLKLVSNDRQETGEKARLLMLEIFRIEPEDSELTREYRRKLSMALY